MPWQAWLTQSQRDEISWLCRPFQRHVWMHACYFNLNVLLCFCIFSSQATSENCHVINLLASSSFSHHWSLPSEQGCSVQGWTLSEDLISEFLTSQGVGDSEEDKQRKSLRERGDEWKVDDETVCGRWIKGQIEWNYRQTAVWQQYSLATKLHSLICVTVSVLRTKYTAIIQHRWASHTNFETQAL